MCESGYDVRCCVDYSFVEVLMLASNVPYVHLSFTFARVGMASARAGEIAESMNLLTGASQANLATDVDEWAQYFLGPLDQTRGSYFFPSHDDRNNPSHGELYRYGQPCCSVPGRKRTQNCNRLPEKNSETELSRPRSNTRNR